MTMNNDMLMTHCCNCGHLVSKSASGTKSIMVCAKCGAEIEVTVAGNVALSSEAGKRYATTESKLKNLKNTAVLAAQRIGDDLNPTLQRLIDGASDLIEKFMSLDESQRLMIIKFAAIAAAAGPAILVFSKIVKGVETVSTGIGKFALTVAKAGGGSRRTFITMGASIIWGCFRMPYWRLGRGTAWPGCCSANTPG